MSPAVADAVLSYMASTFEGGDGELMRVASPAATPLSVDRVQVGAEGGGAGWRRGGCSECFVSAVMPAVISHVCELASLY